MEATADSVEQAIACITQGRPDDAEALLRPLVTTADPAQRARPVELLSRLLFNRAVAGANVDDLDGAEPLLREILSFNPGAVTARVGLAEILLRRSIRVPGTQVEPALGLAREALRLAPDCGQKLP